MSCIERMSRRGLIGRMGRLRDPTQRGGRTGHLVFSCLVRGTSGTRVLRQGLVVGVVSIWRFGRSGYLSSDAPKFVECFNGFVSHGPCQALPQDSLIFALFDEVQVNGSTVID